jgi:hypothetical protein
MIAMIINRQQLAEDYQLVERVDYLENHTRSSSWSK